MCGREALLLKQFLITVAGVLAGLFLFLVIAPIVLVGLISASLGDAPATPARSVLLIDMRGPMTDQRPLNPFASLGGNLALLEVMAKLERAREDDAVKGVYVRANTDGMSAGQAEELRSAFAAFRRSGKFVIAHIQNDGVRQSMAGYMAIADADEVWLQDASDFQAMGLSSENMFLGDTLRRFHAQAQFEAREEFKSAANQLTQSTFTPAHREETLGLMNGLYAVLSRNIAADRGVTPAALQSAIVATPMTAERARELKLVDRIGRPEDAERAVLERAGDGAELVDIAQYRPARRSGGPVIAVVTGEGAIVSGRNETSPFGEAAIMNGDVVARALLDAGEADDVEAILFRVSSPGGSVVASDQILNALRIARANGKEVVISMGEVAASGGYYVSAEADEIVALATTVTGSIGVVGGKIVLGPALEHYASVRTETLTTGSPVLGLGSADRPFTPAERAAFAASIDRAYQDFLALVARGRRMSVAQVREVARGRVWTGEQAKERGLVDHIGGFDVAVSRAKALAGIEAETRVQLRYYPTPRSAFEQLQAIFGGGTDAAEALAAVAFIARDPQIVEALAALRSPEARLRAEAPDMRVR